MCVPGRGPSIRSVVALVAAAGAIAGAPSLAVAADGGSGSGTSRPAGITDRFNLSGVNLQVQGAVHVRVESEGNSISILTSTVSGSRETNTDISLPGQLTGGVHVTGGQAHVDLTVVAVGVPVRITGVAGHGMSVSLDSGQLIRSLTTDLVGSGEARMAARRPAPVLAGALPVAARLAANPWFLDAASGFVAEWLRRAAIFFVLGVLLLLAIPPLNRAGSNTIAEAPWSRLGLGALLFLLLPVLAIALLIAGIFVGIWWLGLLTLCLYMVLLASSYAVTGLLLGRLGFNLLKRPEPAAQLALLGGVALLSLVGLLPYVGSIVNLLALTYGMGALLLAARTQRREAEIGVLAGVVLPVVE
jgi:hypothetical protein